MSLATRLPLRLLGLPVLACLILLHANAPADDAKSNPAVKPSERKDKSSKTRHERFVERAKKGDVDVLFLGDSITQGWEGQGKAVWKARYDSMKAANFGIGGDKTEHVLWRITEGKELEGIQPKVVVLMIGTNNMGAANPSKDGKVNQNSVSASQIAEGVTAIVKEIHKQIPTTKILLLAIFPRAEMPDSPARKKVDEVNEMIKKLDDGGKSVLYLDINNKLLDRDGVLLPEIMPDFLHPNEVGYKIWGRVIEKPLAELLK
jgi:lysophospholipase L1-like esterase